MSVEKIIQDVIRLRNEGLIIKTDKDIVKIIKESRDEIVKN